MFKQAIIAVTTLLILAVLATGGYLVVSAAASALVLGTQTNLSVTPANSGYPKVAAAGQDVYVVWADRGAGSDLEILFRRSENGGASFNSSKNLSRSAGVDSSFPAIAVKGRDVYVVWHEHVAGQGREVMLAMSTDGGNSFTAPRAISKTTGDSTYPRVAVANSYAWIAWSELDGARVGLNLARSRDGGLNFATERLSDYMVPGSEDLVADGDYGFVSGVHKPPSGNPALRIWRAHYESPSSFVTTNYDITSNVNGSTEARLAAADGRVYAFWKTHTATAAGERDEKFYFTRSVDNGATFATPATYNHGPATGIGSGYATPIAITAASGQGATVAWLEANDPYEGPRTGALYAVSISADGTVGGFVSLDTLAGTREYIGGLSLSSDGGFVHATWYHETEGNTEVHAASSRDGGTSFIPTANLSDNPSDSGAPAVASVGTEAYVAWMDYVWGNWEILGRQVSTEAEDVRLVNLSLVQAPLSHAYYADGKPTKIRVVVSNRYRDAKMTSVAISYSDGSGYHVHTENVVLKPGLSEVYLPQQPIAGESFIRPTGSSIDLTVAVNPILGELDVTNNALTVTKGVTQTRPLRMVYRPLTTSTEAHPLCADLTQLANTSARMIEAMYPIDEREAKVQIDCIPLIVPPDVAETYATSGGGVDYTIKDSVFEALTLGSWVGNVDKVVGITRPGWLKDHGVDAIGLAPLPGKSAIVDSSYRGGTIAAHEVAHNFGWVPEDYPGATGAHLNYVAADGYWVVRGQPMTGRYDLMNWAILDNAADTVPTKSWVAKSTYDFLAAQLARDVSDPAVIGLRGTVSAAGDVTFRPAYRIEGDIDLPLANPGAYRLRSLDASGAVLGETGFELDFSAPPDVPEGTLAGASFAYRIPDLPGVKRIVLLHEGIPLGEVVISDAVPAVDITYPAGGETLLTGESLTATWMASDADPGTNLTYTVALSDDNGLTWIPVALDLSEPTVTFEVPQNILSEQVLLKVMASDGINTGTDVSAPFSFRRNLETAGCFGPAVNLTDTPVDSRQQQIATAGSHAYMVWSEHPGDGAKLYFRASADGGETWTGPQMLSDSGYSTNLYPQVAAVGSDVYVAWAAPSGSYYDTRFVVSHDYGQTFSLPVTLFASAGVPQLLVDGDVLYVLTGKGNDKYLKKSINGGDSFTALPTITLYPSGWIRSSTFAISGNNIYLAYSDDSYALKFLRSTNGGVSYSSVSTLVNVPNARHDMALEAQGNNVYLAWKQGSILSGSTYYTRFAVSTDQGATFSTPVDLHQSTVGFEPPQIAVTGATVHVVWERWDSAANANRNVYYAVSRDGGSSFADVANVSATDQQAYQSVLATFENKVYVAWAEDQLAWMGGTLNIGEIKVRASADSGESFGTIRNVSNSETVNSTYPGMAVAGDTVLLHWREAEGVDVHLARSVVCSGGGGEGINLDPVPPVFPAISPPTVAEGTSTTMPIAVTDENFDAIVFRADNLPPFATFEDHGDNTAGLVLAPGFGQAGDYPGIIVYASDGTHTVSQTFGVTVTASNQPPFARPAGPYIVLEGTTLTFDGSASTDPEGSAISHAWVYRGQTYNNAVVAVQAGDDYAGTATLKVRDAAGASQTAEVEVAIMNQPPTVTPARLGTRLVTFTDPGTSDIHTASIDWGDGTSPTVGTVTESGGSGSVAGTHTYATGGTYVVTVTVRDDDSGQGTATVSTQGMHHVFIPLVSKPAD